MANAIYPAAKQEWLSGSNMAITSRDQAVLLVDGYTYDSTDVTTADMSTGTLIAIGDNVLASKTVTGGVFDAADLTFTAVPAGGAIEGLVIIDFYDWDTACAITASTDLITSTSHGMSDDDAVAFTSITTTTGISTMKLYYVVSAATDTFKVSETVGGAAVTLTGDGSCDFSYLSEAELICYLDTGTGLPVTPTGADIAITWDSGASKIFAL